MHFTLAYFTNEKEDVSSWSFQGLFWVAIYPLLFSSILINNFRGAVLYVSKFSTVDDFRNKVIKRIEQFDVTGTVVNGVIQYVPTASYKKVFTYWFGSERMAVDFKEDQLIISGPLYRISQLNDTFTWNKNFKPTTHGNVA